MDELPRESKINIAAYCIQQSLYVVRNANQAIESHSEDIDADFKAKLSSYLRSEKGHDKITERALMALGLYGLVSLCVDTGTMC